MLHDGIDQYGKHGGNDKGIAEAARELAENTIRRDVYYVAVGRDLAQDAERSNRYQAKGELRPAMQESQILSQGINHRQLPTRQRQVAPTAPAKPRLARTCNTRSVS